MLNNIENKILKKIELGESLSPFLFVSENIELLNSKIYSFALELLEKLSIPKVNIFVLKDDWESIKISQIKEFLSKMNVSNPYWIQIFIIENISRFTLQAANSSLKQFEEPWKQNLIFLSNSWESQVLDTILSRVQVVDLWLKLQKNDNNFYIDMLKWYLFENNLNLLSYFYKNKLEKQEYINFLYAIISLIKTWELSLDNDLMDDLLDDIELISKNNVLPKGIIDKWILILK